MSFSIDLENNFFGRGSVIDLLKRRVIDLKEGYRQNLAFIGNRYIGKTSILKRFMKEIDDEAIVSIYIDLDQKDFNHFFLKFAGSLLYQFSRVRGLALHEDFSLLLESTKKFIPQTVEEVKKIQANLQKGKTAESFRDLISLPEIFTVESGKFCVIILDEFHNMEAFDIANIFQELGKKIMTQKRCIYIVTSSLGDVAQQILSEKLSLLFGHFEVVPIDNFDLKTSQQFIDYNLRQVQVGQTLKNFIIDFTGGHPFYISIICQEILNLCAGYNQNEAFLPLLTQAIENAVFNRWGILSRHFEIVLHHLSQGRGGGMVPRLLIALSNGRHKVKELNEEEGFKRIFIQQKLKRLEELGIVKKNGSVYHFSDKLFKYWLKYVYQRRLQMIDTDLKNLKELFQKEISDLVVNFQIISQKDVSTRVVELLHCFDNESFLINGRKYKLPLFSEVQSLSDPGLTAPYCQVLKARCDQETWFIIFKESTISDAELNGFLVEFKNKTPRPQRTVIISLSELEANARLRALQEKIWIWNEQEINLLLNLYDKPYIVK